jgi:site-specific recombinase XerD
MTQSDLANAARILRNAVKDKSYRASAVGEVVGRYVRWARNEAGFTDSSLRDYEAILAKMAVLLADKQPVQVDVEDLRDIIDHYWGGRSPRTRGKVTSVIRSFWQWCEDEGHVSTSPASRLRRPKPDKKVTPLLPQGIDDRTIAMIRRPRDLLGMLLLLDTGIRRDELRQIQVRDFDLERRTLTVKGKGRKERTIPIRGRVLEALDAYLNRTA